MAEDNDDSQKTEEPSQRKLEEAREKGQIVSSREINHWFMISAATLTLVVIAPGMLSDLQALLQPFVETPHAIATDAGNLRALFLEIALKLAAIVMLPVLIVIAAAVGSALLQHGFVFSVEQIKPKLEKISPMRGVKRLFSGQAVMEFVKGVLKLAIVSAVAAMLIWPMMGDLANMAGIDLVQVLGLTQSWTVRLLAGVLAVMTVVAGLDYLYQRFQHMKKLRMSKQEVKEEMRQSEGDPHVKARLRQIRMERARRRMMAAVPTSDVVITNPTHYAVALSYDPQAMTAPRLVAKGIDQVALRIRELAKEHAVPVVENPPLARGLHAAVDLDQEIPPEHYKAVAEVIGYIMKLKRRSAPQAARA